MERILIGLPDMAITKVESLAPCVLPVQWKGENRCPHCGGEELRTKDSFWRDKKLPCGRESRDLENTLSQVPL